MPELPEVEIMRENLYRWMAGKRVVSLNLVEPSLDAGGVATAASAPLGCVTGVVRRGKYAAIRISSVDGENLLVLHFRMTGKVVLAKPEERRFVRMVLALEDGETVVFVDSRRLGQAWWIRADDQEVWFAQERCLGPDAWPETLDADGLKNRLGKGRVPIKNALMDQQKIAGLGNIAASEILWYATVNPRKKAHLLSHSEWARIAAAVPQFVETTLNRDRADEIDYINEGASNSNPFSVYQRTGQPCLRCGSLVVSSKQGGRSTFWCAVCQRDDLQ